jgi:hypothetical protein
MAYGQFKRRVTNRTATKPKKQKTLFGLKLGPAPKSDYQKRVDAGATVFKTGKGGKITTTSQGKLVSVDEQKKLRKDYGAGSLNIARKTVKSTKQKSSKQESSKQESSVTAVSQTGHTHVKPKLDRGARDPIRKTPKAGTSRGGKNYYDYDFYPRARPPYTDIIGKTSKAPLIFTSARTQVGQPNRGVTDRKGTKSKSKTFLKNVVTSGPKVKVPSKSPVNASTALTWKDVGSLAKFKAKKLLSPDSLGLGEHKQVKFKKKSVNLNMPSGVSTSSSTSKVKPIMSEFSHLLSGAGPKNYDRRKQKKTSLFSNIIASAKNTISGALDKVDSAPWLSEARRRKTETAKEEKARVLSQGSLDEGKWGTIPSLGKAVQKKTPIASKMQKKYPFRRVTTVKQLPPEAQFYASIRSSQGRKWWLGQKKKIALVPTEVR